ncbi:hypothetical protein PQR05_19045 [Paraburkholderia sediminicola]|uniref:Transmembrane protein n=1 Tax=Paraburkholderia metrosideri TaxID=580937 RepID=A0ABW9DJ37_9BURK
MIRIGKELGIWWGGYATNFINSLASPSLAMRGVAFIAWAASAAAFAYVLRSRKRVLGPEAFQLFLIYCATHVSLVRFLTSVAFYNVYIAAFWIGAAVFVANSRRHKAIIFSIPFFFFSFYLNSLLLLYALLFACLLYEDLRGQVAFAPLPKVADVARTPRVIVPALRDIARRGLPHLLAFARQNALFIALPFVFLLTKRLTTIKSPLYDSYNEIVHHEVMSAMVTSFTLVVPVLRDFFSYAVSHTPGPLVAGGVAISFVLLQLLPRTHERPTLRFITIQVVLGLLLFAAATYPYIVVGKVPDLTSFYESRHIMPAVAGLDLLIIAIINCADLAFGGWRVWRWFGRNLLVAYVVGASVGSAFNTGSELWRDWFRQTAIMDFARDHQAELKDVRTFVIDDKSFDTRIGDRMVWNYEYTGNLITVYGTRDRFGVGVTEYTDWSPAVPLLINTFLRQRYNIANLDFRQPHAIITLHNGLVPFKTLHVLEVVNMYLHGENWRREADRFTTIDMAYEQIEAEDRVAEMYVIAEQLARYKLEHGAYPAAVPPAANGTPYHQILSNKPVPAEVHGDIPGLFPDYMARPATMQPHPQGTPEYVYISDGQDYKLIYANPPDYAYTKQSHPALIDRQRQAYGVWTLGARAW